jgi:hypothetical protein
MIDKPARKLVARARTTLAALAATVALGGGARRLHAQAAEPRAAAPTETAAPTAPPGPPAAPPLPPQAAAATADAPPAPPLAAALAPPPPSTTTTTATTTEAAPASWFARAPLTVAVGHGARRWTLTFYGFVEADFITDSTRSYGDAIGGALVARDDTFEGTVGRTQFSIRNTRLGLAFAAPPMTMGGVRPSAVIEGDFFGNQPGTPPAVSESSYYDSPGFRVRHAYARLDGGAVDVVAGQTYDLFGWQNFFFPCSVEFLGLPNQLFSRHTQLRLSRTFGAGGPVSVDVAVAAVRPGQRDSAVPDADGGLRLSVNDWKGISTPGNVGTAALPLSIGVSGRWRQFNVNAFTPPPTQTSNHARGWGASIDALIPIIPARDAGDRGNRLTLTGSFVVGTGIADLITAGGGARFPLLPNPAQTNPPPVYAGDVDNGLVSFDTRGVLHTINWRALKAGLQYYFPGSGRLIFAANYTEAHSDNMAKLFPMGGAEIELLGSVVDTSRYADANLFWDATPEVRLGLSGQFTRVHYLDGDQPRNLRGMAQVVYVF